MHRTEQDGEGQPADEVVDHRGGHDEEADVGLEETEIEQRLGDDGQRRYRERHAHEERKQRAVVGPNEVRVRQEDAEQETAGERHRNPHDAREERAPPTPPNDAQVDLEARDHEEEHDGDVRVAREHDLRRSTGKEPVLHPGRGPTQHRRTEQNPRRELAEDERKADAPRGLAEKARRAEEDRE